MQNVKMAIPLLWLNKWRYSVLNMLFHVTQDINVTVPIFCFILILWDLGLQHMFYGMIKILDPHYLDIVI